MINGFSTDGHFCFLITELNDVVTTLWYLFLSRETSFERANEVYTFVACISRYKYIYPLNIK